MKPTQYDGWVSVTVLICFLRTVIDWWGCMQHTEAVGCMFHSCVHQHQILLRSWTTGIKASRHSTLAGKLESVGHLSSCNLDLTGRPWARFDHVASVSPLNYKHVSARGHYTACRIHWNAFLAWEYFQSSHTHTHSICIISMALSMLQQGFGSHADESLR